MSLYKISLQELLERESAQVEWKENVGDCRDVVATLVAFANDISNLGGGYVVCGAKEITDEFGFPKVDLQGLTSSRYKAVECKVMAACKKDVSPALVPSVSAQEVSKTHRILIFSVTSTGQAHSYQKDSATGHKYYIREGHSTREAQGILLTTLLAKSKALPSWDIRPNRDATIDHINLLTLQEYLKQMKLGDSERSPKHYLSDQRLLTPLIPAFIEHDKLNKLSYPKNFTLLMFCSQPTEFFDGAYTVLSVYPGKDRSEDMGKSASYTGTIVEQARQVLKELETELYMVFDKTDSRPNQEKYPKRAVQEAVINALVHRDYEARDPTRITVFSDRIEIYSPGSLPSAINCDDFLAGKATPHWRNQALAQLFIKLQLAQTEGQGIPTILRTAEEAGCPKPEFKITPESVICILKANPKYERLSVSLRETPQVLPQFEAHQKKWNLDMQRLNFTHYLQDIVRELLSVEILALIESSIASNTLERKVFIQLLNQSQRAYIKLANDTFKHAIIQALDSNHCYSTDDTITNIIDMVYLPDLNYSHLFQLNQYSQFTNFVTFHRNLIAAAKLAQEVLLDPALSQVNEGYVVFRIYTESQWYTLPFYVHIFQWIQQLLQAIYQGFFPEQSLPDTVITLLDSGENIDIGVQTDTKVALGVRQLFVLSHKQGHIDGSGLHKQILKNVEKGILTEHDSSLQTAEIQDLIKKLAKNHIFPLLD